MKRFWFFDLDGTLADTDPDIRGAWKAALADLGLSAPTFDRDFVAGPPIEEMAKKLLHDVYTPEIGMRIRERFALRYDHDGFPLTKEYPGVLDAVKRISAAGGRVFIATNKRYAGAVAMAEHFGWNAVFEKVYAGDMHMDDPKIGRMRKPALVAFIMREHGAKCGECVLVGDTCSDFEAARANSIESVGVAWGYGDPDELAQATRIARTPADIGAEA